MAPKRIKARPRTAEEAAREQAVRQTFADRPSVRELIDCGELIPTTADDGADSPAGRSREAVHEVVRALHQARVDRGLTLTAVAARAGLDPAQLSRLEGGKNDNPTFETVNRVAAALGMHLDWKLVADR